MPFFTQISCKACTALTKSIPGQAQHEYGIPGAGLHTDTLTDLPMPYRNDFIPGAMDHEPRGRIKASRHRGIEPSITEYMELINRNICRNIQDPQSANLHSGTKIKTHKTHKTHNPQKLRHPMTLLWLWEAQRRWARHTGQHTSPHLRRAKREKHTVSICFNPNPVRSVSIAEKIACSHMFSCTYVFYCVVLFFARPHASIQCHTSISLSQRKRHLRGSLTCHIYSIEE